jgi:hypothetical protein
MSKAPSFRAAGSLANILFAFKMPSAGNTGLFSPTFLSWGNPDNEAIDRATLYSSNPEKLSRNHKGFTSCVSDQVSLDLAIDVAGITPLTRASEAGRKASKS